jgi:hypothetical protein
MSRGNALLVTILVVAAGCGKVNSFTDANQADCDDSNPCTVDAFDDSGACQHTAGNAGTVCRATAGDCDVEETCDGTSMDCPDDVLADQTVECRASTGDCDPAELCAGDSADCPADVTIPLKLYAATGSSTTGEVYVIDPTTGAVVTDLGAAGFSITGMRMQAGTHTIYATTGGRSAVSPGFLAQINPATGAATLLGTLGTASGGTGNQVAADIDFDATGRLYGWMEISNIGNDDLATIDLTNFTTTTISDSTLNTAGSGLSFDANGNLVYVNQGLVITLDPSTGLALNAGTSITGTTNTFINALALNPQTGTMYAVAKTGGGGLAAGPGSGTGMGGGGGNGRGGGPRSAGLVGSTTFLITLDPATAVGADVDQLPNDVDAIAFACEP